LFKKVNDEAEVFQIIAFGMAALTRGIEKLPPRLRTRALKRIDSKIMKLQAEAMEEQARADK